MTDPEEARLKFGRRIQRCVGCFVAFYVKDLWLAGDATFHCVNCKDDTMFHFDDYSRKFDLSKLPSMQSEDEPHP